MSSIAEIDSHSLKLMCNTTGINDDLIYIPLPKLQNAGINPFNAIALQKDIRSFHKISSSRRQHFLNLRIFHLKFPCVFPILAPARLFRLSFCPSFFLIFLSPLPTTPARPKLISHTHHAQAQSSNLILFTAPVSNGPPL